MKRKPTRKISIKRRILINFLVVIGAIFLGIMVSFYLVLETHLEKRANNQLTKATQIVGEFDQSLLSKEEKFRRPQDIDDLNDKENIAEAELRDKPWEMEALDNQEEESTEFPNFMREIKRKVEMAEMRSEAQAIILSENYELLFPTRKEDYLQDIDEYEAIINKMKKNKIELNDLKTKRISIEEDHELAKKDRTYYISFVEINSLQNNETCYVALLIDVSNTLNLAKQISLVLMVAMSIAGVFSILTAIFLSRKISRPIQEISRFAKRIGEGDFRTCTLDFSDKELDELSQVMNKSAQYLDRYDKEQKIFFQNASHELRTPLMSIKGYAEAIKYDVMNKESASNVILEETDRLTEMVEDLLYLSKMDNITKDYPLVECDMREILSNCALRQKAVAVQKGIQFHYDFDEKQVLFCCDEKSMARAFSNLIDNGLRYAKTQIKMVCKVKDDSIIISVEDDGEGIKEKDFPHLFDRFYKGEKGKHGIGLAIVQSIVWEHNGTIYAENSQLGAKFSIVLKL